jgi:hypothetical protein
VVNYDTTHASKRELTDAGPDPHNQPRAGLHGAWKG